MNLLHVVRLPVDPVPSADVSCWSASPGSSRPCPDRPGWLLPRRKPVRREPPAARGTADLRRDNTPASGRDAQKISPLAPERNTPPRQRIVEAIEGKEQRVQRRPEQAADARQRPQPQGDQQRDEIEDGLRQPVQQRLPDRPPDAGARARCRAPDARPSPTRGRRTAPPPAAAASDEHQQGQRPRPAPPARRRPPRRGRPECAPRRHEPVAHQLHAPPAPRLPPGPGSAGPAEPGDAHSPMTRYEKRTPKGRQKAARKTHREVFFGGTGRFRRNRPAGRPRKTARRSHNVQHSHRFSSATVQVAQTR